MRCHGVTVSQWGRRSVGPPQREPVDRGGCRVLSVPCLGGYVRGERGRKRVARWPEFADDGVAQGFGTPIRGGQVASLWGGQGQSVIWLVVPRELDNLDAQRSARRRSREPESRGHFKANGVQYTWHTILPSTRQRHRKMGILFEIIRQRTVREASGLRQRV